MRFYNLFLLLFVVSFLSAAPAPILTSIPYFGNQASSPIQAVAVDPAGNIYIAGTTAGGIPIVNALQPKLGGGNCAEGAADGAFQPCPNIFVAKFDPSGTKLIYSTYLSGNQSDYAAGLAVDSAGNAYIAGTTQPAGPIVQQQGGNAFVEKLSPDGSTLLYTRYIGGNTMVKGIAVDSSGDATIAGYSIGPSFPSVHPLAAAQPSVKSLYVTNDGGITWRNLNNGLPATNVNSLAVDPTTPSTLYAATSIGLYKSTNAGSNWMQLLPSVTVANTVVVDPKHPSTVYATYTGGPQDNLAKSVDGGATWTTISDNFPPPSYPNPIQTIGAFTIDPGDSNVLWAIIIPFRTSTVIKSTDGGAHWQVVYTFPPDIFQGTTLVGEKFLIDPQNRSRLYACCIHDPFAPATGGVYRSNDGGNSWVQGAVGPSPLGILSPWLDPHNSSVLYGAAYTEFERSSDAGMTWSMVTLPSGLASGGYEPGGLAIDAAGTLNLLNDGGYLLRSADSGASWTKINGPWSALAGILAIDPTNSSTMYVASGTSPGTGGTPAQHAFAAKLDAGGTIQWATLLGGSNQDQANAVALDASGNAYITGTTSSDDFPLVNPFQKVRGHNAYPTISSFVSKISADGSSLLYSSFLGGTGRDSGNAIAVDASGNAYVAGGTMGGGFPVTGPSPYQPANSNQASFLAKVDPTGGQLVLSTLLTGSAGYPALEQANAVVVDPQGRAIVAGITADSGFPLVNAIQPDFGLGANFIARLSGAALDFSTYLGGLHNDLYSIALAPNGSLWTAGINGLARIDFQPPATQPGVPQVFTVYNAASFNPGDVVAPGEIVTLIGAEFAPGAQAASSTTLPRTIQGVSVLIGGVAAPLFYVSPGQINFQMPVESALGSATLAVQRGTQRGPARTLSVVASAPGVFAVTADVRNTPVLVHASDYSLVTQQNPAHPGEYLAAFCTGLGATNPPAVSGQPAPGAAPTTAPVVAIYEVGGNQPANYAGLAPGWVGLYQINFQVDPAETSGLKELVFLQGSINAITFQAALWVQ